MKLCVLSSTYRPLGYVTVNDLKDAIPSAKKRYGELHPIIDMNGTDEGRQLMRKMNESQNRSDLRANL